MNNKKLTFLLLAQSKFRAQIAKLTVQISKLHAKILKLMSLLVLTIFCFSASVSNAGFDIAAPTLLHDEVVKPFQSGEDLEIMSYVQDDTGVESVKLFFRLVDEEFYRSVAMDKEFSSDTYKVVIPATTFVGSGVEHNTLWVDYYIEAIDFAGNTVMRGYAFAPLKLSISNSAVPLFEGADKSTKKMSTKRKWLWVGLGVITAGVLASAGGSEDTGPEGGVDAQLTTGPITITAGLP